MLEALVADELPAPRVVALRQHANSCQRCGHELKWLLAERRMFEARALREELAGGTAAPRRPVNDEGRPKLEWIGDEGDRNITIRPQKPARHAFLAMAASVLVVFGAGRRAGSNGVSEYHGEAFQASTITFESATEASRSEPGRLLASSGPNLCTLESSNVGFHCGPSLLASFSRGPAR
jgi:hypothetical protein